jgi:ABC-2 type transport system ATP-binding protein
MEASAVVVEGLKKRYGETEALVSLSFVVAPGEVVGLLGPNGAGKTTTLKILLGLLRPTAGRAEVLGLDCSSRTLEVKERIGYFPDEPAFYDFLTGRETLDFVARVRGIDAAGRSCSRSWSGSTLRRSSTRSRTAIRTA